MRELPPKELILLLGYIIFFGLCACLWIGARIFPGWDARQLARQRQRQKERQSLMNSEA